MGKGGAGRGKGQSKTNGSDASKKTGGNFFGGGGYASRGDYFEEKHRKLKEQFSSIADGTQKPQIFNNLTFWMTGRTCVPDTELKQIIVAHGGVYEQYGFTRVTHIIADNLALGNQTWRELKNRIKRGHIVTSAWVMDCTREGRRIAETRYMPKCLQTGPTMMTFFGGSANRASDSGLNPPSSVSSSTRNMASDNCSNPSSVAVAATSSTTTAANHSGVANEISADRSIPVKPAPTQFSRSTAVSSTTCAIRCRPAATASITSIFDPACTATCSEAYAAVGADSSTAAPEESEHQCDSCHSAAPTDSSEWDSLRIRPGKPTGTMTALLKSSLPDCSPRASPIVCRVAWKNRAEAGWLTDSPCLSPNDCNETSVAAQKSIDTSRCEVPASISYSCKTALGFDESNFQFGGSAGSRAPVTTAPMQGERRHEECNDIEMVQADREFYCGSSMEGSRGRCGRTTQGDDVSQQVFSATAKTVICDGDETVAIDNIKTIDALVSHRGRTSQGDDMSEQVIGATAKTVIWDGDEDDPVPATSVIADPAFDVALSPRLGTLEGGTASDFEQSNNLAAEWPLFGAAISSPTEPFSPVGPGSPHEPSEVAVEPGCPCNPSREDAISVTELLSNGNTPTLVETPTDDENCNQCSLMSVHPADSFPTPFFDGPSSDMGQSPVPNRDRYPTPDYQVPVHTYQSAGQHAEESVTPCAAVGGSSSSGCPDPDKIANVASVTRLEGQVEAATLDKGTMLQTSQGDNNRDMRQERIAKRRRLAREASAAADAAEFEAAALPVISTNVPLPSGLSGEGRLALGQLLAEMAATLATQLRAGGGHLVFSVGCRITTCAGQWGGSESVNFQVGGKDWCGDGEDASEEVAMIFESLASLSKHAVESLKLASATTGWTTVRHVSVKLQYKSLLPIVGLAATLGHLETRLDEQGQLPADACGGVSDADSGCQRAQKRKTSDAGGECSSALAGADGSPARWKPLSRRLSESKASSFVANNSGRPFAITVRDVHSRSRRWKRLAPIQTDALRISHLPKASEPKSPPQLRRRFSTEQSFSVKNGTSTTSDKRVEMQETTVGSPRAHFPAPSDVFHNTGPAAREQSPSSALGPNSGSDRRDPSPRSDPPPRPAGEKSVARVSFAASSKPCLATPRGDSASFPCPTGNRADDVEVVPSTLPTQILPAGLCPPTQIEGACAVFQVLQPCGDDVAMCIQEVPLVSTPESQCLREQASVSLSVQTGGDVEAAAANASKAATPERRCCPEAVGDVSSNAQFNSDAKAGIGGCGRASVASSAGVELIMASPAQATSRVEATSQQEAAPDPDALSKLLASCGGDSWEHSGAMMHAATVLHECTHAGDFGIQSFEKYAAATKDLAEKRESVTAVAALRLLRRACLLRADRKSSSQSVGVDQEKFNYYARFNALLAEVRTITATQAKRAEGNQRRRVAGIQLDVNRLEERLT